MKRFSLFFAFLLAAVLLVGCGSLRTYTLEEILPAPVEDATLLPLIESVTLTRASDGAEITVTGTDVEMLMLVFDGIPCTRTKSAEGLADYTLTFTMTDKADVRPPLYIVIGTGEYAPYFLFGEYEYDPVNLWFDTAYIDSLLD